MPTYEYACTSCGHRLEAVQSFSDPALTTCPVCQGPLRKVFGNVGIVLKGSGFYKTDSRKAGGSNGSSSAPRENKEKESSSSSDSGSKDSGSKAEGAKDKGPASTPAPSSSSGGSEKAPASSSP